MIIIEKRKDNINIFDTGFLKGSFDLEKLPQVIEGLQYLDNKNYDYRRVVIENDGTIKKEK
jgi:hypothetical protein